MSTLSTNLGLFIRAQRHVLLPGQEPQRSRPRVEQGLAWPDGSGVSEAEDVYIGSGTIVAAASTDLDLGDLSQLDGDGNTLRTVAFAEIKALGLVNTNSPGGGGRLEVGGAAVNEWIGNDCLLQGAGDIAVVLPGGSIWWINPAGGAVTGGSADTLTLAAVAADQSYELIIVGDN